MTKIAFGIEAATETLLRRRGLCILVGFSGRASGRQSHRTGGHAGPESLMHIVAVVQSRGGGVARQQSRVWQAAQFGECGRVHVNALAQLAPQQLVRGHSECSEWCTRDARSALQRADWIPRRRTRTSGRRTRWRRRSSAGRERATRGSYAGRTRRTARESAEWECARCKRWCPYRGG